MAENGIAIVGRVVNDRQLPVSDASVTLRYGDAVTLTRKSDPEGLFHFEDLHPPAVGDSIARLAVRAPDGRVATGRVPIGPAATGTKDAGLLVLRTVRSLAVRVRDGDAPVPGARVLVSASGSPGAVPDGTTGPDGVCTFDSVPRGSVGILALAEQPARAGRRKMALTPETPMPAEITLRPARRIEVRVLEVGTDRPIPGATLDLMVTGPESAGRSSVESARIPPVAPTDAEGRTWLDGILEDDEVQVVQWQAPGRASPPFLRILRVEPGSTSIVLRMPAMQTLRFPLDEGEVPPPADGTVLVLAPGGGMGGPYLDPPLTMDEPTHPLGPARMQDGVLCVENCVGKVRCLASAPDGSWTRLRAEFDRILEPARFLRPRRVEIVAHGKDGLPAAGETFAIHDPGSFWHPVMSQAVTGSDGRAVLAGLPLRAVATITHKGSPDRSGGDRSIGTVDLREGDARIEATVAGKRAFELRVTIDGRPGLPGEFRLQVDLQPIREFDSKDPLTGELRFRALLPEARAGAPLKLTMTAPGLLWTQTALPSVPGEGPIRAELAVRSGGVLVARVRPPEDGYHELALLHLDPVTGAWEDRTINIGRDALRPLEPGGEARVEPLAAGRYRIVECASGVASPPIDVKAEDSPAHVELDLSSLTWAEGRIHLPDDESPRHVRLLVRGEGIETPEPTEDGDREPARPRDDGSFRVRIPGDRPVLLVPWHEDLVPAQPGGEARLSGACRDVVLRLVHPAQIASPPGPDRTRSARAESWGPSRERKWWEFWK